MELLKTSESLETNLVSKSNDLIEASYRLNLDEMRIILTAISMCDGRRKIPDEITITADQYADTFDLNLKNAYKQMMNASKTLYERDIKVYDEGKKRRKHMRWLSAVVYHDGHGRVTLTFSNTIKKYMGDLKGRFTSYRLMQVKGLKSIHSIRIFELLQQYQNIGKRTIDIDWLRDYLDIKDKHKEFKFFKQDLLKPALKEINEKTNLTVTCTPIREGRKFQKLCFNFSEDRQLVLI